MAGCQGQRIGFSVRAYGPFIAKAFRAAREEARAPEQLSRVNHTEVGPYAGRVGAPLLVLGLWDADSQTSPTVGNQTELLLTAIRPVRLPQPPSFGS